MPTVATGQLVLPRAWVTQHMFSSRRVLGRGVLGHGHANVFGAAVALASGAAVGGAVVLRLGELRERLQLRGNPSRDRQLIARRLGELAQHEVAGRHLRATGDEAAPYELCEMARLSLELEGGAVVLHAGRRQALRTEPLASWFDMVLAAGQSIPWMREDLARQIGRRDLRRNVTRAVEVLAAAGGEHLELEHLEVEQQRQQRLIRVSAPLARVELEPWIEREPAWPAHEALYAELARAATAPPGRVLRPIVSARRGGEPERARFASGGQRAV